VSGVLATHDIAPRRVGRGRVIGEARVVVEVSVGEFHDRVIASGVEARRAGLELEVSIVLEL